jgi:hypothetical protein
VCATLFNHQRQLFGVRLLATGPEAVMVETPAPGNPFDLPTLEITRLLGFAPEGVQDARVKVVGTVAYCNPGTALFIQDDESGLFCQTLQRDQVKPGDLVEVGGFPARGENTPVLEDVLYRKIGEGTPPEAQETEVSTVLTGIHDCRLVTLPAKVLDRVDRGLNQFLLLQAGGLTFEAFLPPITDMTPYDKLKPGAEVVATGICRIERGNEWEAGSQWRAASFHMLLRSPEDVIVLSSSPSMDVADETWVIGGVGLVAVGLLGWVVVLRRRVHTLAKQNPQAR